ncbi:MAG TPA: HAMP domain-containing protein, partial [Kofleriaceae bacterium]|nr:HAMP domain-containing protein [Kofleriaceae bacterium]
MVSRVQVFRFRDWSVRRKLVALLVLASLVPLAVAAVVDLRAARTRLRRGAGDMLAAHVDQLRSRLDEFNAMYLMFATKLGQLPPVVALGGSGPDVAAARVIMEVHASTDRNLAGLGFVDRTGAVIVASEPRMEGKVLAKRDYVRQALSGTPVISDVYVAEPELTGRATVAYAAPIPGAGPPGALVLWVRADALWQIARSANDLAGPGSFSVILDGHGIRIAHSTDDELVFHPAGALEPEVVGPMVAEGRFGPDTRHLLEDVREFPEAFARARAAAPDGEMFRGTTATPHAWSYGVARRLGAVPWTVICVLPERDLDEQLARLTRDKLILAGLIMIVAFGVGLALAAVILRPVVSLSAATSRIAGGDLSARVPPAGDDELGRLCASFNAMAARIERDDAALRAARSELEERVAERTAELIDTAYAEAKVRAALETTTARLEVLSRTGHELAAASGDAEAVLALAARRLSEIIGESCAIRLISEDGGWLEPTGSYYIPDPEKHALAGPILRNIRQRVGEGVGGRVAASGEALLIPEITMEQVLALGAEGFRELIEQVGVSSLLTLPLRSRERTIGVVNLMRSTPGNPYTLDDQ